MSELNLRPPSLPRPPRIHTGANWRVVSVIVLFLAAMCFSGFAGAWLENRHEKNDLNPSISEQKRVATSESRLINQIAKNVAPSVVSVNVNISAGSSDNLDSLFGGGGGSSEEAAGTGIILSDNVIITNRHVVPSGTTSVSVTLSDGTELKDVSVIGRTSDSDTLDVAFLKVNDLKGHKLTPAKLGDSSQVLVGDNVVAIGNALGQFQNSVTSGIISGYGRQVQAGDSSGTEAPENLDNLIQTDAAINEGNSGGPLVNMNGEVIGINTATAGDAQNIGFAIPINDVHGLINQVLKTGKFSRPYLGIRYVPLSADVASQYNLSVENGAFIVPSSDQFNSSVVPGSPADKAGLQEKDVITAVDGTKIDQTHSLTSLLGTHQPGDQVKLTVVRGDKTLTVTAKLDTMPGS